MMGRCVVQVCGHMNDVKGKARINLGPAIVLTNLFSTDGGAFLLHSRNI